MFASGNIHKRFKLDKKLFWPSKKIDLFYQTKDQNMNFLKFNEVGKAITKIPDQITIQELSNRMAEKSNEIIKFLFNMKVVATINHNIDKDTAEYLSLIHI